MQEYWHSVILDRDLCTGCTKCMHSCPTQAIRVVDGKAKIIRERCIDCGECIKVCPYHAKGALSNDLEEIEKYKYKIVVPSISLYGQFPVSYDINRIINTFLLMGFDHVYDMSYAADIISAFLMDVIENNKEKKPLISTYCPAVTRLIQIRYPSLIDNINKFESPLEVAARLARIEAKEKTGLSDEEIGVFYITQCPAKITSIEKPIGLEKSEMTGAISISKVIPHMVKLYDKIEEEKQLIKGTGRGIGWGRVGGMSYSIQTDDFLAVDGIDEVIKVLDQIEIGKLSNIDFFEGYACVTGCAGGPLNVENPFICKNRIRKIANSKGFHPLDEIKSKYTLDSLLWHEEIEALTVLKLDPDFKVAIRKMSKIEEIYKTLPNIDCGACGSPSCRSLAEDIVMERETMKRCVVNLKLSEEKNEDK